MCILMQKCVWRLFLDQAKLTWHLGSAMNIRGNFTTFSWVKQSFSYKAWLSTRSRLLQDYWLQVLKLKCLIFKFLYPHIDVIGILWFCIFMDLDFIFVDKTQEENLANIKPSRSVTHTPCSFHLLPPQKREKEQIHTVLNTCVGKGHLSSEN